MRLCAVPTDAAAFAKMVRSPLIPPPVLPDSPSVAFSTCRHEVDRVNALRLVRLEDDFVKRVRVEYSNGAQPGQETRLWDNGPAYMTLGATKTVDEAPPTMKLTITFNTPQNIGANSLNALIAGTCLVEGRLMYWTSDGRREAHVMSKSENDPLHSVVAEESDNFGWVSVLAPGSDLKYGDTLEITIKSAPLRECFVAQAYSCIYTRKSTNLASHVTAF